MKLQKVAIRRYRSIEEMDAFEVEPDVTCLVGKNESGKTAVLQALNKSHLTTVPVSMKGSTIPRRARARGGRPRGKCRSLP
ncbi:ATP-binding protein [Janibacter hoylei]|uniref:ATP-binding protein n=1 Tax=Janibacter hoylei TaxID=364298 RepID=UPI0022375F56|nr:ATP-binding protein [Janibacter hoylei]MCW4600178.1 ATP-binding protein [Janibacter hoylei]